MNDFVFVRLKRPALPDKPIIFSDCAPQLPRGEVRLTNGQFEAQLACFEQFKPTLQVRTCTLQVLDIFEVSNRHGRRRHLPGPSLLVFFGGWLERAARFARIAAPGLAAFLANGCCRRPRLRS